MAGLSVIIPCLNEAQRLPLLLADLQRWPGPLQIVLVDGGSVDRSVSVAALGGARSLRVDPPGRGSQLASGARQASHLWMLFVHADSRLPPHWSQTVVTSLESADACNSAWYFPLQIEPATPTRRLLEGMVNLRSRFGQTPYGDQGLLIHRRLYEASGGFAPLPLMEDLDLVERIGRRARLRPLGCHLITDGRRWERSGVMARCWQNARLRWRWRRGESAEQLAAAYYGWPAPGAQLAYQKPQR